MSNKKNTEMEKGIKLAIIEINRLRDILKEAHAQLRSEVEPQLVAKQIAEKLRGDI